MNKNSQTIKFMLALSVKYPIRFGVMITLPIINVLVGAFAGPFIIAHFFNLLQSGQSIETSNAIPLVLAYLGTQLWGEFLGWRIVLYALWTLETAAQRDLLKKVFSHLSAHSMSFHNNRFGGSIVSQTSKLFGSYERFTDTLVFQLLPIVTSIVGGTVILAFVFWQYAVALLVLSIIFIAIVSYGTGKMVGYNTAEAQASTASTGRLADAVTNMLTVKSFAREDTELTSYMDTVVDWRKKSLASMSIFLKLSSGYSVMIAIMNSTALLMAILAVQQQKISAGVVYICVSYTLTIAQKLWEMNSVGRNFNRIIGDAYDMIEILSMEPEIKDPVTPEKVGMSRGEIQLSDVTFSYGEQKKPIFNKLNLKIKPGEKIGLVSRSGSGKTTLTKLLLRFNDIDSGAITIDGQNISSVKQTDLRSRIAYVPQEPMLFHRSIADNIRYGDLEADDQTIKAIAKMSNTADFIETLPEKYNTLVGERGVKLSGGQRQRIAIARAMIKNAPILILDEATSALDSESEELIQDALWRLMDGRTAIVIAHRLSTIQQMDRIIVMDNGKIIEEGSHKDLLYQNGEYAKLWNKQSGGFMEE